MRFIPGTTSDISDLRGELEGVIGGLNAYLVDVRQKADRQSAELVALVRERTTMLERMRELEQRGELATRQTREAEHLREVPDHG